MGDLISKSTTINPLRNYADLKFANREPELSGGILKAVSYIKNDNIPTEYDVEKVIQQLEENKEDAIKTIRKVCNSYFAPEQADNLVELLEVYTREQIGIVKKGGV